MEEKNKGFMSRFQDFLDTEKGRVLLNFLYSWGAAVVILGALFKLTHIGGANLMLFIGMGTEVLVFFISGFEKPFVPKQDNDQEENINVSVQTGHIQVENATIPQPLGKTVATGAAGGNVDIASVEDFSNQYVERIKELTEKLAKISEQSEHMAVSTQEIETLGRNLTSINRFYEMQLRSVSSQMDTIDMIGDKTRQMVGQIDELNRAYARIVEAMKATGINKQA